MAQNTSDVININGDLNDDGAPNNSQEKNDGSNKRKRDTKKRSIVWSHFTKFTNKEGTNACKCNHCKKIFSLPKKGGTSHMRRYITDLICPVYRKKEAEKQKKIDNGQKTLAFERDGSKEGPDVVVWKFDQDRSRRDLCELIIIKELPFSLVEDRSFRKFAWGLSNKFKFMSRNTMKSDCIKRYEAEKNTLEEVFRKANPRVCLTTDTWTSKQELPFMALTAHFIDDEWKLHKKIINFVIVPVKATGENLTDLIECCLLSRNIERICTITMDNHSANDVVARLLADHYSSRGHLMLGGKNMQVRCWGHILNLIVQEGLDDIKECIKRVREAVKYVKASPKRKIEFLQYADQERIPRGKMLVLDVCTRWNSTYLMLGSALHYRMAYDRMKSRDLQFKDPPTSEDWQKAQIVHDFLETFYDVTNILSGSQFCTANVFFREVYRILVLLCENSKDESTLFGGMASSMLTKFEKYWKEKEPNILLLVALVLDPRYKLKYLRYCYSTKINDSLLVGGTVERVEKELHALFNEYLAFHKHRQDKCSSKDTEVNHGSNSDKSSLRKATKFMEEFYKFSEEEDAIGNKSELEIYLEEKLYLSKNDDDFDILQYWKINESKFPVFSRMAKDILAIPVSSVASESAFSTGGRVLSKFRSSLLPSTVEALICAQDWIRSGPVHMDYDEEFDTSFSEG